MRGIIACLFVILLLFFAITLFFLFFAFKAKEKEEVKKKDKSKVYFEKQRKIMIERITGINIFRMIQRFLKDAGNPYGITFELYIFCMFFLTIAEIYVLLDMGLEKMLILGFIFTVPPHIMIFKSYQMKKDMIRIALCDVQDIIYFQDRIGTNTAVILASAAKFAKDPLKIALEKTASCYKVTRNLDKALDIMLEASSLMEVQAFAFNFKQKEESGFSEDNHKAQGIMMKRNKRLRRKIERSMKRTKLVIAAVLLFACYTFMIVVPILKEVFGEIIEILG